MEIDWTITVIFIAFCSLLIWGLNLDLFPQSFSFVLESCIGAFPVLAWFQLHRQTLYPPSMMESDSSPNPQFSIGDCRLLQTNLTSTISLLQFFLSILHWFHLWYSDMLSSIQTSTLPSVINIPSYSCFSPESLLGYMFSLIVMQWSKICKIDQ